MAHHDIKFEGLEELKKGLAKRIELDDVKRVVKHNGAGLQQKAQDNADFTKGYATGTTKRSIGLALKDNGLTSAVSPGTEYAPYLEFGTRFMEAQPYLKPAWEVQKELFQRDMSNLVK